MALEPGHLRLQLERELKGKVTALRTRLLGSGGDARALTELSREALPAFVAFFQAYLELTTGGFPSDPGKVLDAAAQTGLKVEAFQKPGAGARRGPQAQPAGAGGPLGRGHRRIGRNQPPSG